ncbi:MAG: SDR family oxidoreductase [Lysinibacillus sp.]
MTAHLFTGFPGFIASHLIRQLFQDEVTKQIYAIVLLDEMEKAKKEAEEIEKHFPSCRIELVEGDITLPNLGIDDMEFAAIAPRVHILWHLAAIYDLAVERKAAWKVNVHGTANVNDFVRQLPNLKRYMYFSTAYVAGRRHGLLLETELVRPPAFKNYYEETKYEAELRVEDLKAEIPLTILRPGIVCGHSKTGETVKFDGPYFFLNMMDTLRRMPFIPYIGSKKTTINVVPVDYVARAASYMCQAPEAEGRTFHLTDPHPPKVYKVYCKMAKQLTGKRVIGRLPLSITKKVLENYRIRKRLGVEYESVAYLAWHAEFDASGTQELLQHTGITCPDFLDILPVIVGFYEKNKNRREIHVPIK